MFRANSCSSGVRRENARAPEIKAVAPAWRFINLPSESATFWSGMLGVMIECSAVTLPGRRSYSGLSKCHL